MTETAQKQLGALPAKSGDVLDVPIAECEEDRLDFELFWHFIDALRGKDIFFWIQLQDNPAGE